MKEEVYLVYFSSKRANQHKLYDKECLKELFQLGSIPLCISSCFTNIVECIAFKNYKDEALITLIWFQLLWGTKVDFKLEIHMNVIVLLISNVFLTV